MLKYDARDHRSLPPPWFSWYPHWPPLTTTPTHIKVSASFLGMWRVHCERVFALRFRRDVVVACFRAAQAVFRLAHVVAWVVSMTTVIGVIDDVWPCSRACICGYWKRTWPRKTKSKEHQNIMSIIQADTDIIWVMYVRVTLRSRHASSHSRDTTEEPHQSCINWA